MRFRHLSVFSPVAVRAAAGGVLAALAIVVAWGSCQSLSDAGFDLTIVVNTAVDEDVANSSCSLREAIITANTNTNYKGCAVGALGDDDHIVFNVGSGTPVINVPTPLPVITDGVSIEGNSGGATRVELRGPCPLVCIGFTPGLHVNPTASGTRISRLVINGFPGYGIVTVAPNVKLVGNFIGTASSGMFARGNNLGGVHGGGSGVFIGGTNGVTPGGPCTGDCNLISGNAGVGISSEGQSATVQGNFIGTNATGSDGLGNGTYGIETQGNFSIGGATPEERNVISGNGRQGIIASGPGIPIRGNFIGTNAAGTASVPNLGGGIVVLDGDMVGGSVPGEGNVISGNSVFGISISGESNVQLLGNFIGVAADGTAPLPNASPGDGVILSAGILPSNNNVIGGAGAGQANVIAFNARDGVRVDGAGQTGNSIRGNSIHDNGGKGIENIGGGNIELAPPVVTGAGSVAGTACANCAIDVYSDSADEGRVYEGSTTANGSGNWIFTGSLTGPNVTATATDADGNTSEFSAPVEPTPPTPTPSPTPSPSPTPTPTATPTATEMTTPTPTPSPTPTPTQTPKGSVTPTPTLGPGLRQGDVTCDREIGEDDAFLLLLFAALLDDGGQIAPCPDLGEPEGDFPWGDVNCDGVADELDALYVLAFVVGIELPQGDGCEPLGDAIQP